MVDVLTLEGCRPTPLASYLKGLGVLRLVAEQADPDVRGFWSAERFHLKTCLDRDHLRRFFLEGYAPTPVIAPWNGRAGFLEGDNDDGSSIDAGGGKQSERVGAKIRRSYETARPQRFERLKQSALAFAALPVMAEMDSARARAKELQKRIGKRKRTPEETAEIANLKKIEALAKSNLLTSLRSTVGEDQFAWLDVCVRLADGKGNSPLLIAGGADGSRDYGVAFGSALLKLFRFDTGAPTDQRVGSWLSAALFSEPAPLEERDTFGHFHPGQGGYNGTAGFEGAGALNPWDVILTLEGAVLWSGGVTRRLDGGPDNSAGSFPFSVGASRSGAGQSSTFDKNRAPGELWCPLWERPSGLAEIRNLFREGRLTVGRKSARTGLDAAVAVAALGRSRGVSSFVRVGLYQSDAKMPHTAAPLRRHTVGSSVEFASLAAQLTESPWMSSVRRAAEAKTAPATLRTGLRFLDDALFDLVAPSSGQTQVQGVISAVGYTARLVADRPSLQEGIRPPPLLGRDWTELADNGTIAFRLAAALAGLSALMSANTSSNERGVTTQSSNGRSEQARGLYMCQHLAPLDPHHRRLGRPQAWNLSAGRALFVWEGADLTNNLCAVAQRRVLEFGRLTMLDKPFEFSCGVDAGEVSAFLEGSASLDHRVSSMLAGLVWTAPARWSGARRAAPLPFAYAALKPLFVTNATLKRIGLESLELPIPPALMALLMSGQVEDAIRLAQERARASGLPTPFLFPRHLGAARRPLDAPSGRRLLASLIIPVRDGVVRACLKQAYPSAKEIDNDD